MNKCFIKGSVNSDVNFCFTLQKNPISIATFTIELSNHTTIKVYAFNEIADYCYKKLQKNAIVFIEGRLSVFKEYQIIIEHIYIT